MSSNSPASSFSASSDQSAIIRLPSPSANPGPGPVNIRKRSDPLGRPPTRQSIRASIREFIGLLNNPLGNKRNSSESSLSRVSQSFRNKYSPSSEDSKSDKFVSCENHQQQDEGSEKRKRSKESAFEECALCFEEYVSDQMVTLTSCEHRPCQSCFAQYLKIEISESRILVVCPVCDTPVHPNDIYSIIQDRSLLDKYEDFMVRRVLVADPDARWCPAPDCGFAVIAAGCAGCPNLKCERPGCGMEFCYHCKAEWHPDKTCDAARSGRKIRDRADGSFVTFDEQPSSNKDRVRNCPRCNVLIMKVDDGSCNHMTCAVCGAEFCWLCMKEISDLHYLSPSGCTFWGKKPWSRKKKILWQVGTLIGAPVGIALLAGIAVPAIMIGVPFWVGRKLSTRSRKKNREAKPWWLVPLLRRPFLAALAVALGVPICLAYVYGVVPVSLCRSGGCGVTTSTKGGVKIDLHENPDLLPIRDQNRQSEVASFEGSSHGSKAPFHGGGSLGLSSNSLESGRGHDVEAVNRNCLAMEGSSYSKRLDGCSETNSKRLSLTSETVSLSERSVTLSCTDDCSSSTRGFAGSVLGYKFSHARNIASSSLTPAEVYIDGRSQSVPEEQTSPSESGLSTVRRASKRTDKLSTDKHIRLSAKAEPSLEHVIDIEVMDEPYITPPEARFTEYTQKQDLKSLAASIAARLSEEVMNTRDIEDNIPLDVVCSKSALSD